MASQLFKTHVPIQGFVTFLLSCCDVDYDNNLAIVNNNSYKRAQLAETLQPFLDSIIDCYHKSKQHYVSRKMNYTRLITVIRQICKDNQIPYVSKIKYDRSSYEIIYYICFDEKDILLRDQK